ncbi:MAG TPA: PilN domain-containing protein [Solirubrobacterales bacterium]|nr:PilN domain-containing protein [Solirubrobacterales bacterium]
MRPVNLIPAEDRRGDQAPLRTGPLAYIVTGALVALLIGVAALVLTGNEISERKDELATLEREDAAASAQAARLASYTQFRDLSEQRVATVQSLADSRFDWERVLRELSLVLPGDVALTELSASGAGGEGAEGSEGGGELSGLAGPSLTMSGCAAGYAGVAGFVTALNDIDGVTRVGVQSSSETSGSSGGGEGECGGGSATVQFTILVAFDAAPVPVPEGEVAVAPEAAPEAAQAASSETSESSGEGAEGG